MLTDLRCRLESGGLRAASYAALYFLHEQVEMHGKRFASRRFKTDARPDPVAWVAALKQAPHEALDEILLPYLERYNFLGVIPNVCVALGAWLRGTWALTLCEYIPSPEQVLRMQVHGTRPVTILARRPTLQWPVLGKPNAFAFMVHDLEHAYKFFHDLSLHQGQRNFFTAIAQLVERGGLDAYLRDPVFKERFHYLISDMNTHPGHSLQFLRAILIEFHLRLEGKPLQEALSERARTAIAALMRRLSDALEIASPV